MSTVNLIHQPEPDEQALYTAIRSFILAVLVDADGDTDGNAGTDIEVIQGVQNRVPMPDQPFISMTTVAIERLSSNHFDYEAGQKHIVQPQKYSVQLDCYGEPANHWATLISTVLRDGTGCAMFPEHIQPLYHDDPKHLPISNAEQQYEKRWMLLAHFQVNAAMSINI